MASVSGLSAAHRIEARDRLVKSAWLAYKNRDKMHYTQGSRRWDGIRKKLNGMAGQFPNYADCSSFVTWLLWVAIYVKFKCRDTVNGQGWLAGFTGTILSHGKRVVHQGNWLRGDLIVYGNGGSGKHTAVLMGKRPNDGKWMVMSFGSEAGPLYLEYDYRSDIMEVRRCI